MQYNINVANGTGMEVRTNLNLAHQSLATNFFGATDPSLMSPVCAFPGSTWADTGNGLLKVRNADDSDWIVIGTIESDGTPKITSNGFIVNASDVVNTPSGTISATNVQDAINELASGIGLNLRKPSTVYAVGDIAYSPQLPSWARLECVKAGTTDSGNLPITSVSAGGVLLSDGSVLWIIDDVRDCTPVGAVRGSLYLPSGYVLANGATVDRADYPRLVRLADTHNLWTNDTVANAGLFGVGDGSTKMVLPNWIDRMEQMASTAGASVAAGLPNITGALVNQYGVQNVFVISNDLGSSTTPTPGGRNGALTTDTTDTENSPMFYPQTSHSATRYRVSFSAQDSNSIYGASTTVQPPAIKLLPILRY